MKDFKSGVCNTLIATCVAEEGIDVGEVDLIVCFDVNNKNPTRYIQRIGRTGRRRQGKVIMLVTEGKEQSILREVIATKDGTNQKISKSSEVTKALYRDSPRIVPPEFHPQCMETYIKVDDEQTMNVDERPRVVEPSRVVEPPRVVQPSTSKVKKPKAKSKSNKRVQPSRGVNQPDIRKALAKHVELDDEILRDFDVPNVLNASMMSHSTHDETMSEQLYPVETSLQRSTDNLSTSEKFMKICERYREQKKCSNAETKPLDAAAVINNPKLAKPLKLLWLQNNLKFVREHHTHQKTSRLYSSIARIVGGERSVQRMLTASTEQWTDMKPMRQQLIFQMLNLVDREPKENVPENDQVPNQAAAMAFESQHSFGFVESKYASQFESQIPIPASSTHDDAISSSTPKRIHKIATSNVQPPIDSPINSANCTSAFQERCANNKKVIPDTVPYHLRYLGLSSIDDLFADSDDEDDVNPQPNASATEKIDANSNNISTNAMAESDLFADESMAMSKSFNTGTASLITTTTTTTTEKPVKKLYVGSISDLFRDDDFNDDDNDVPVDIAKDETISKTGSDDTEEYDFDEIISIMEVAEATAMNRIVNTSDKENQNKSQAQVVVQQKSDDLFATYNETIDTNANRSSANETTASKFTVPSPPKTNDKKKHSGVSADSNSQHSPTNRLNYAIIQDKSPSLLNRSSMSRSHSGTSSKSLLGKFNSPGLHSDAQQSIEAQSLQFSCSSTSNQPRKLNFSRLKTNAVASMDNTSDETTSSQFLTCREATTNDQNVAVEDISHIDQMNMNISTESDEDEIFATCKMVRNK